MMPLANAAASPELVTLGGEVFLAAPLPLWAVGAVLRHLERFRPADAGESPLSIAAPWAWDAMTADDGFALVAYGSLRAHGGPPSYAAAYAVASAATDRERSFLISIAWRRMPRDPGEDRGDEGREKSTLAALDWGRIVYDAARGRSYRDAADMTLDQVAIERTAGGPGEDDGEISPTEADRMWREMMAEADPDAPATVEGDLARMGLSIVPDEERPS